MEEKLQSIQSDYSNRIHQSTSLKDLDTIFLSLFGRSGKLTSLPKQFSSLPKEQLQIIGPLFNRVKDELSRAIEERRTLIREEYYNKLSNETLELNDVEVKNRQAYIHPLTAFEDETAELF